VEDRATQTDVELLRAVADGDTGALRVLHERHSAWLTVRLLRRCNDRGAGSFRGEGEVAGWLWGVAIRRLVATLRSRGRNLEVSVPEVMSGSDVSVEDRVLSGVEYGDAGAALARLSPEMRAVVQATVLDGLTTREAGQLLGVPRATVKTRLHRAKAQLRRELVEGSA
jgi:RNA polymerase sigma factor (sigma-70 family)